MRSRKYDKDGQTHFVTELYVETIKFMSPKSQNNEILSDSILDIDSQNIDNHDLLGNLNPIILNILNIHLIHPKFFIDLINLKYTHLKNDLHD